MKKSFSYKILSVVIITMAIVGIYSWYRNSNNTESLHTVFPQEDEAGNPIGGIFEGVTPCDSVPKPLPQIPTNAPCDHMVWKLVLYQNSDTLQPTTYILSSRYGRSQQNTPNGHIGGGTMLDLDGAWSVTYGTESKPDAEIYRLTTNSGVVSFIKVSDNVLHLLDQSDNLMVGNGGWSYSLNRTDDLLPQSSIFTAYRSEPVKNSEYGVFVGRTPCDEIAQQIGLSIPDDCSRIKWEITFYQDPTTYAPTTYKIRRVDVPDDRVAFIEGNWINTQHPSGMTVYKLDLNEYNSTLYFAKGDNNVLFFLDEDMNLRVGSDLQSYTLSRKL